MEWADCTREREEEALKYDWKIETGKGGGRRVIWSKGHTANTTNF